MDAGEVIEVSEHKPIFKYWDFHPESFDCLNCPLGENELCILDGGPICPAGYDPDKKQDTGRTRQDTGKLNSQRAKEKAFQTIRDVIEPALPLDVPGIGKITDLHTATIYNWVKRGWLIKKHISQKKYLVIGVNYDGEDE